MAVLVIGGVSYIGSHTARSLKRYGYEVLIYDNFSTGFPFLAKGFELITSDVTWLPETFRSNEEGRLGDALCGTFLYRRIYRKPAKKFLRNNVEGGLALLNTAIEVGLSKLIFSSTCVLYGVPAKTPIVEDTPRQPVNPYGTSKLFFKNALSGVR